MEHIQSSEGGDDKCRAVCSSSSGEQVREHAQPHWVHPRKAQCGGDMAVASDGVTGVSYLTARSNSGKAAEVAT